MKVNWQISACHAQLYLSSCSSSEILNCFHHFQKFQNSFADIYQKKNSDESDHWLAWPGLAFDFCWNDEKWLRALFDRVLPAWSWEMLVERELPAKLGRCSKKPPGRNFDFRAKSSWEKIFIYVKNFLSGGFCSKVKIAAWRLFVTPSKVIFFSRNKGQLRAAVTRPCRLPTPLCHTYSEPSGHEDSPGGTKNSPKNGSLNRDLLKFLNRYGIFWVPPGESSCPDGSEYVWQRGVESL